MLQTLRPTFKCHRRLPAVLSKLGGAARWMTTADQKARNAKLVQVYKPFQKLDKNSPEYKQLARSGKVWEDYFRPYDSEPYKAAQRENQEVLDEIDDLKKLLKLQIPDLAKALVPEYAHQSVWIENNPLSIADTVEVFNVLTKEVFNKVDLSSLSAEDLLALPLPQINQSPDTSATNELKNHLVVSQWLAERAATSPGTAGFSETEVRQVDARLTVGTDSESNYSLAWGRRTELGEYRRVPIKVNSNPLEIFPYPAEIPACMERFFKWRDTQHAKKELHPLVFACHLTAYFVHIHPFLDGNGRCCRALMHDYMVRQGYLPVVFQCLERGDYLRMIGDSHASNPEEFVSTVLWTQKEQLWNFYTLRNH